MINQGDASLRREAQLLEHNFQQLLMQKQSFQFELNEIINALNEISKSKGDVYRVMSNIMIKSDKESLKKELDEKKKSLEMHLQSLEKQEKILESKIVQAQNNPVDKSNLVKSK